jgi:hypothetical protein
MDIIRIPQVFALNAQANVIDAQPIQLVLNVVMDFISIIRLV